MFSKLRGTWLLPIVLFAAGNVSAEGTAYVLGAGAEADAEGGLSLTLLGDVGLGEATWLSAAIAHSETDALIRGSVSTVYGDLGLDHFFEPVGVRVGIAYWGDSDTLDSVDVRGALYWRGENASLSVDAEQREFDLQFGIPGFIRPRSFSFDATGIGLTSRFDLSESTSVSLHGMDYDYSIDLRVGDARNIRDLVSVTRLSMVSSLVDYRAGVGVSFEAGLKEWGLEYATWRTAVDGAKTNSFTVRWLTPMSSRTDIELGLGYDDSDLYGDVGFLSVFVYFYGGG